MTPIKTLMASILCATLASPALAQSAPPPQGGASGEPSDSVHLDPTPFIQEVDTNKDGNVSKQEWQAAGLVEMVFSRFDSNNKGYLTKSDLAGMYHPPTLDSNKDGKLSLAEMKAHMAKQAAAQPAQGAAPPK
jgi:Ca2+-binding EF-hand superfamily protein